MKKIYSTLILLVALSISHAYAQCMLSPISLTQRVNNSALIIEGTVVSKKSFWNPSHNYIQTSNLIQVKQHLKGSSNTSFIEVITEGGEIDLTRISVEPSLQLEIDQEGVFMVNEKTVNTQFGYPTYEVYADAQGFVKFNVKENSASDPFNVYSDINTDLYTNIGNILGTNLPNYFNGSQVNKFNLPASIAAAITGISPTTISAGTFSIVTITGSGFGTGPSATNFVEFRNADDGGATFIQPHSSQYVSWTNTQIQVRVPTRTNGSGTAGTGQVRVTVASSNSLSAQTLNITHGQLNVIFPGSPVTSTSVVYNTRHVNDNTAGGITWQMFTGFDGNAAAKASFLRAIKTWTCTTYINWVMGSTVSTNTITQDNINVVRFDVGSELPAGVLGRCTSYFSGCGSNPNMNWFISELDIVFDDATNWQYGPANATGSQYDFESVAVHELGHGHQLAHVINTIDVMHYSIANAQNKRTLNVDDITGGNAVMTRNLSGGVCSLGAMTALNPASCSTVAPTASFAVNSPACVGAVITLTDQSLNGPTGYTWTMTGGTPASSNASNPTVSYATPGTKTITLVCSNGNGTSAPFSKTVSVVAAPVVAVTSASICPGKTATLVATGATTYTWNPGNLTGGTQALSPTGTTVYTVTGSNGTCTANGTGTVTVLPGANVNVPNAQICTGTPTLMTATGATSYTWNPGNLNGTSQTFSPSSTTVYTVTGSVGTCTNVNTFTITVSSTLAVSISPATSTICVGQTTVLTANGASSYTWNTSATTTTLLASNATTTTYSVTGKTGNCTGTATAVVNVSTCAGITENTGNNVANVYPNPTEGMVNLKFTGNYDGKLEVYNAIGQLIMKRSIENKDQVELNLSNEANGVYMIKLISTTGTEKTIKVVKE